MTIIGKSQALAAYGAALRRAQGEPAATTPPSPAPRFESLLKSELAATQDALRASEVASAEALSGRGDLQQVVEAVTEAELGLQKLTAMRDRMISAYQEIMRMPI
jgi:flagellar hook-basal body complex protein FliE